MSGAYGWGLSYVLSFPEPTGAVSFAGAYGFSSLGILAGLAAGQTECVRGCQEEHRKAWISGILLGVALTAAFCLLEILQLARLGETLRGVTEGGFSRALVGLPDLVGYLFDLAINHEKAIAFCLACACAVCGGICMGPNMREPGTNGGMVRRPGPIGNMLVGVMSFLCGALRPFAWVFLYPHPAFPIPVVDSLLTAGDYWASAHAHGAMLPIVGVAVAAFVTLKKRFPILPGVMGGFACGELVVCALERLTPELLGMPVGVCVVCLLGQIVCAVAIVVLAVRGRKGRDREADGVNPAAIGDGPAGLASDEVTPEEFMACVSQADIDILVREGLTPGEINAVRAAVLDLDSTLTAEMLGVQPTTVRTYRRRVCAKLNLVSIDSLAYDLVCRRGLFAGKDAVQAKRIGRTSDTGSLAEWSYGASLSRLLSTVGYLGSLLCLLLPYGSAPAVWTILMVVAFGIGLGLLLSAGKLVVVETIPRVVSLAMMPAVRVLLALGVLICALAVAILHMGDIRTVAGSSPAKLAWVLVWGACVSWCVLGLVRLSDWALEFHPDDVRAAACGVAVICVLACMGNAAWVAAFSTSVAAAFMGRFLTYRGEQGHIASGVGLLGTDGAGMSRWEHACKAPLLVFSALVGFAWEEAWRGRAFVSFEVSCLPVLAMVCVLLIWLGHKRFTGWPCMVIAVSAVVMAHMMGLASALLFCSALLALPCVFGEAALARESQGGVVYRSGGKPTLRGAMPACLVAVVAGIGTGVYGVNVFGSFLLRMGYLQHRLLLATAITAVAIALGVIAAFCMAQLVRNRRLRQSKSLLFSSVTPERLQAFLIGKGLDGVRSQLVALLVEGVSVSTAAGRLGYSRGATHRMRMEAFAVLGVSTQKQLMAYLVDEFHKRPGR